MVRAKSLNRDKAKEVYLNSKGSVKLKYIAEELGVKDS
ncbi:phage terminase small subunit-related protein [Tepidibacter hydrothermalis]|uniref:Phage terminase small subunit-related protein n=1 Tax=Tepidibacter hydrothermalis TaxID=3036126 RepID=A0ABY8EAZ4_9FIRM|nr:phage terminase small subunit-related protein [Tepidibacter hydrothermalis]WFD08682.1 phage terminase small subunit-related protein [Tepidibacter hydrothermalis]